MRSVEERIDRLEAAIVRLAEAQAHTEERLSRLESAVERLAEAQRRTEERLGALAEAQTRTDERVGRLEAALEKLAEAQRRTEEAVRQLAQAVGRLSDTVGYGLEDVAKVVLPGYLERHLGIRLSGELGEELKRQWIGPEGSEVEINLYGEGEQQGQRVVVLGEAKSRIYGREVEQFDRAIQPIAGTLREKVVKVMVGYLIHPSASRMAAERDILLIASYQR